MGFFQKAGLALGLIFMASCENKRDMKDIDALLNLGEDLAAKTVHLAEKHSGQIVDKFSNTP